MRLSCYALLEVVCFFHYQQKNNKWVSFFCFPEKESNPPLLLGTFFLFSLNKHLVDTSVLNMSSYEL